MRVRRAGVDDAAAVADVHVRSWQIGYEHVFGAEKLATLSVAARLPRWREILAGAEQVCLVAEADDGSIVGWCTVGAAREPDLENAGEIWGIYAAPEAWGSGAGAALMAAGLEALRELGFDQASLWVLDDNPRARRFYEREGWALDDARKQDEFLGVAVEEVRYRRPL
jgi:ribosomal protein S18 acetylase RimI-like enzyme